MLVDLHAHFPMHLLPDAQQRTHERARTWWRQWLRARLVELASGVENYQGPGDTPGVTEALMRAGDVGVTLSVLYQPLDEMDLDARYGAPPRSSYATDLLDQLQTVEDHVARTGQIAVARSPRELDECLAAGVPALVHAVEGGFQIGADSGEIRLTVRALADRGVAYITVAHLFFRDVATNAPALPFLPDRVYHLVFPQRRDQGLTALGRELVHAMVDDGVLIDVTHMSPRSLTDTLDLLDARGQGDIPVIATHMACRFGGLEYCLPDEAIGRIAAGGGLLGLIMSKHFITSGQAEIPATFEGSMQALVRHIDHLRDITGGYEQIAIGSDLDGYIKPALPGLEHMGRMGDLQQALGEHYGGAIAERICSANALQFLRAQWQRKRPRQGGSLAWA
jgi:microsomal dipeptidase-like Zn-dependent dipeptidase